MDLFVKIRYSQETIFAACFLNIFIKIFRNKKNSLENINRDNGGRTRCQILTVFINKYSFCTVLGLIWSIFNFVIIIIHTKILLRLWQK